MAKLIRTSLSQAKEPVRTSGIQLHGENVAIDGDAVGDRSPRLGRQVGGEFEHIASRIRRPRHLEICCDQKRGGNPKKR